MKKSFNKIKKYLIELNIDKYKEPSNKESQEQGFDTNRLIPNGYSIFDNSLYIYQHNAKINKLVGFLNDNNIPFDIEQHKGSMYLTTKITLKENK